MGIIEDPAIKARDAFDVVAKKTGEVYTVQKLKFTIASLNSQLSKDFETLGRLYYESMKDENADISDSVKDIVEQIEQKKQNIAEYEAEIEVQKKVSICPQCGGKNASDALFCNKCGKKL